MDPYRYLAESDRGPDRPPLRAPQARGRVVFAKVDGESLPGLVRVVDLVTGRVLAVSDAPADGLREWRPACT